jgi:hypothetical protein
MARKITKAPAKDLLIYSVLSFPLRWEPG